MAETVSGMTGALQGTVGGVLSNGQAWIDSVFPPEKRNELMAKISKFATEKPMLAVCLSPFSLAYTHRANDIHSPS